MDFVNRRAKKSIVINITSLVDVILIILIFVLASTTFLEQPALNIELPHAESSGLQRVEELVITISKTGVIYFNKQQVTKDQLLGSLEANINTDLPVVLKADKGVAYGLVIEVMDILNRAGIKKIVALTMPSEMTAQ